jgi:transforming growth factor-beta-induced protein
MHRSPPLLCSGHSWTGLCVVLLAASLLTGCDGIGSEDDGPPTTNLTVAELAATEDNLSTFNDAIEGAGLADTLDSEDATFTIFAPVDSAFADYNLDALTGSQDLAGRVLGYHAIAGETIGPENLSNGKSPETLDGGTITINTDDVVTLNGRATVTTTGLEVNNGIVYLIDDVLLQRTNAVQRTLVTPNFSLLADLISQTGLADDLRNENGLFTVFAPTNEALLTALDEDDSGDLEDDERPDNAQRLLQYHVANSILYKDDEPTAPSGSMIPEGNTDVSTLTGSSVLVQRDGDSITLNPENEAASVVTPDVDVTNGVIHGIDTVLSMPSSRN